MITAIDVCCGGGGWAVAARGLPIEIIAAFDWEEFCVRTYKENHPATECHKCDVTHFDFSPWRGVDLILGGIPCEDLSAARGMHPVPQERKDKLDALIRKMLALPGNLKASWYCYEDVVQLAKLLPDGTPRFVLDSQHFSAQRRRRMYVGNCPAPSQNVIHHEVLSRHIRRGPYRRSLRLDSRVPGRARVYNSNKFYPWMHDEKSPTVIGLSSRHDNYAATEHRDRWRQLEWQELASLQGFPDDYLFLGSPSNVTKMVGQAVQIDTARAILTELVRHWEDKQGASQSPAPEGYKE